MAFKFVIKSCLSISVLVILAWVIFFLAGKSNMTYTLSEVENTKVMSIIHGRASKSISICRSTYKPNDLPYDYFITQSVYKNIINDSEDMARHFHQLVKEFRRAKGEQMSVKRFKHILLAINFNIPHYNVIPLLAAFYKPLFGKVIFCGDKVYEGNNSDFILLDNTFRGYLGYNCIATAIRKYPHYSGYIHSSDDVLLNWWNALSFDQRKVWTGDDILHNKNKYYIRKNWSHWDELYTPKGCEKAFEEILSLENTNEGREINLSQHIHQYYKNTNNQKICIRTWSDFFYIPSHLSKAYGKLLEIFSRNGVFLEAAVTTSFLFVLNRTNSLDLAGQYYKDLTGNSEVYFSGRGFYMTYDFATNFSHPFKLNHPHAEAANLDFFLKIVGSYGCNVMGGSINENIDWFLR